MRPAEPRLDAPPVVVLVPIRGHAPLQFGRADAVLEARGLEELYRSAEAVTATDWSAR